MPHFLQATTSTIILTILLILSSSISHQFFISAFFSHNHFNKLHQKNFPCLIHLANLGYDKGPGRKGIL